MDNQSALITYKIGDTANGRKIGKKTTSRYIWQACTNCGKQRWVLLLHGKPHILTGLCRSCSKERNLQICQPGESNPMWKGGRCVITGGYVIVKLQPEDEFFASMAHRGKASKGYIAEHRLVMAKHLGRCLQSWEVVHHKNGDKQDNRLTNLELVDGLGKHSCEHNKGYRDGFAKGYYDGKDTRIKALQVEIGRLKDSSSAAA